MVSVQRFLALAFALLVAAPGLHAQPFVDGISFGLNLTSYHGDLDANPTNGPAEFLAAGSVGAFVGADREFGPVIAETVLHYDRVAIDFPRAEMDISLISLDLNVGKSFNLFRPDFIRVFAGVSPTRVMTSYENFDAAQLEEDGYKVDEATGRFMFTFPVGIVIQDALRIGARFTPTDKFDSVTGVTESGDLLTFYSVGYRIDLLD